MSSTAAVVHRRRKSSGEVRSRTTPTDGLPVTPVFGLSALHDFLGTEEDPTPPGNRSESRVGSFSGRNPLESRVLRQWENGSLTRLFHPVSRSL